ncbi:HlyC/CorC family transporter, partial [Candidatus Uhrbacteria bacterium]|nr:HlyC/CorC family transporter [Candidatus Uhrbacteria bacterium]
MTSSLILLFVLLAASAASSAAETGLFSFNKFKIRTLAEHNASAQLVEKLRANPRKLLGTILIANNVTSLSASALTAVIAIRAFGSAAVGVATAVIAAAVIIFCEFIPKAYAAHHPERVSLAMARPVWALTIILGPLLPILERFSAFFVGHANDVRAVVSEEEIKTMVSMGEQSGGVERGERELIERVFLFNDIVAEDVMTPREQVVYLDGDWALAEALEVVNASKFSRFPIYEKSREKIIGIVHIKDIFEKISEAGGEAPADVKIRDVAGPAIFVPSTKLIDDLFREFQKEHAHMALIINEFGSVIGLVTLDDLLEELV